MAGTRATTRAGGRTAGRRCDHCGRSVSRAGVVTTLRRASLVFCDEGCHDDHVVQVALSAARCTAPGCDLDAVADVPFCDEHVDHADPAGRAA